MAPTVMLLSSASGPSPPQAAHRSMATPAADLFLHPAANLFLHPAARRPFPACTPSISLIFSFLQLARLSPRRYAKGHT